LAAVSASGWGAKGFIFLGFLPRRPGKSKRVLQDALGSDRNVVLFESPFRVAGTLKTVFEIDPRAHVTVARELTKIHEEFIRGSVADVLNQVQSRTLKGELIIIIAPADMMPGAKTENEHEN
jgi:16S rRNA (cytidine1402-2'-O)-methyltransferase